MKPEYVKHTELVFALERVLCRETLGFKHPYSTSVMMLGYNLGGGAEPRVLRRVALRNLVLSKKYYTPHATLGVINSDCLAG